MCCTDAAGTWIKCEAMLAQRLRRRWRACSRLRLAAAPHLQETSHALGTTGDCLRRWSFDEEILGCFFPAAGPLNTVCGRLGGGLAPW